MNTRTITCAGQCTQSFTVDEPPPTRPLTRAIVALASAFDLFQRNWEFDGRRWWCKHCRVRKRLLKAV